MSDTSVPHYLVHRGYSTTALAFRRRADQLVKELAEANINAANDYIAKIARLYLLSPKNGPEPEVDEPRVMELIRAGYEMALASPKGWEIFTKRICGDYRKQPHIEDKAAILAKLYGQMEDSARSLESGTYETDAT